MCELCIDLGDSGLQVIMYVCIVFNYPPPQYSSTEHAKLEDSTMLVQRRTCNISTACFRVYTPLTFSTIHFTASMAMKQSLLSPDWIPKKSIPSLHGEERAAESLHTLNVHATTREWMDGIYPIYTKSKLFSKALVSHDTSGYHCTMATNDIVMLPGAYEPPKAFGGSYAPDVTNHSEMFRKTRQGYITQQKDKA